MDASADLAEEAVYDRMVGDQALTDSLGHSSSDERIKRQRPRDVLGQESNPAPDDFPLLTYFAPTGAEPLEDFGRVRMQFDVWVWPEGTNGGIDKLREIDSNLRALFYRERWTWNGMTFDAEQTSWRSGPPAGRDRPMQRTREFGVGVNLVGA